jgi:pimeloyl-ACP methyl ester carboxylesterase
MRYLNLLMLVTAALLAPSNVASQSPPVVLVHGLNSSGPAWNEGLWKLRSRLPATEFWTPTLPSFDHFLSQANVLRAAVYYKPYFIAVGHSNGGNVIRTAAYEGQQFTGAVAMGSPLQGAPLADRAREGTLVSQLMRWNHDFVYPVHLYGRLGWDFYAEGANAIGFNFQSWMQHWLGQLFNTLGIDYATRQLSNTVVAVMGETGFTQTHLNTPYNLSVEPGVIPQRYSIAYSFEGPGIIWKGLTPMLHGKLTWLQWAMVDVYMEAFNFYSWYYAPDDHSAALKRAFAPAWLTGAYALARTDIMWCGLVGVSNPFNCESDGIVPTVSMAWPGGEVVGTVYGLGHMEETSHDASMDALADVLRTRFGAR